MTRALYVWMFPSLPPCISCRLLLNSAFPHTFKSRLPIPSALHHPPSVLSLPSKCCSPGSSQSAFVTLFPFDSFPGNSKADRCHFILPPPFLAPPGRSVTPPQPALHSAPSAIPPPSSAVGGIVVAE